MTKGSSNRLTWTSNVDQINRMGSVALKLLECYDTLCDEYSFIYTIANNIQTNEYAWNIPLLSPPVAGVDYALLLESMLHPNIVSTVSPRFTMSDYSCDNTNQGVGCSDDRNIILTEPKAGSTIVKGRRIDIKWTSSGKNQNDNWIEQSVVIILHSRGGGNDNKAIYQIASQVENIGEYSWFVTRDIATGDQYTIRVYPVDRMTTNSQLGLYQFRSSCPEKSINALNCESGTFSINDASSDDPNIIIELLNDGNGLDG
jgi:hypothetical protein